MFDKPELLIYLAAVVAFIKLFSDLKRTDFVRLTKIATWQSLSRWENWKKIRLRIWISLVFGIAALMVGVYISIENYRKELLIQRVTAKFGDLSDLHGATIPRLRLGLNTKPVYNVGSKFKKDAVFYMGDSTKPFIKLYIKNDRLFITTIIRTTEKKVIATIYDGKWDWIDDDGGKFEYNNNDTAFEVIMKEGLDRKVYFQAELKGGVVGIAGLFLNEDGDGILLGTCFDDKDQGCAFIDGGAFSGEPYSYPPTFTDVPIFKYPRGDYVGVRVDSNN